MEKYNKILISFLLLFFITFINASDFRKIRMQKISPFSDTLLRKSEKIPNYKSIELFRKFNINNSKEKNWKIRFNPMTNIPEAIVGDKTKSYSGKPEEIFFKFLDENKDLLKVDYNNIKPFNNSYFAGITHLYYQQYYKNLPVEFSYVKMHINSNGEISGYQAKYYPDINIDINPSINSNFAEIVVKSELGNFTAQNKELVIYPDPISEKYYLAWKIKGRGGNEEKTGFWIYYVDANSGKILFKYDDFRYVCVSHDDKSYGTVQGYVYDISPVPTGDSINIHPNSWQKPQLRNINNQYVWVGSYANKVISGANGVAGEYCSNIQKKVFALLQGPYFSVVNFKGASSYYTNGNINWLTASTFYSSPNPYDNNKEYTYNITLPDTWSSLGHTFAFVAPIFVNFRVGSIDNCGNAIDEDMLYLKSPDNENLAFYAGNRSNFIGGFIPNPSYKIFLKTDGSGTFSGFNMNISSYMVITNPDNSNSTQANIIWSTWTYLKDGDGGEINAFYHLNKIRDFFQSLNKDPNSPNKPINLDKHVPVMVHFFGDQIVPNYCTDPNSMYNAYYDLDKDIIVLGDGPIDLYDKYRDFALDGTIVRHEYIHLVVNRIYPIINFGEFGAISEAMADYFSLTSFWNDAFDINILGNFIGSGEAVSRDLSQCVSGTPCTMPTDWRGEVHDDSLMLSRALYKLRKNPSYSLGTFAGGTFNGLNKADVFTFAALFYFPDNFSNFLDAYIDACKQIDTSVCNTNIQNKIINAFSAHGITSLGYASSDIYEPNNGPEWATDISSINTLSAYIDYQGDIDYYSIPLNEGPVYFRLDLPLVSAQDMTYNAYSLILFDSNRRYLFDISPEVYNTSNGYCPSTGHCLTISPYIEAYYVIPKPGRYYIAVAAAPGEGGGNGPGYNTSTPYKLTYSGSLKGSISASITMASLDNDEIEFSVPYPVFQYQVHPASYTWNYPPWISSEVKYEYARLLDHNLVPLTGTETNNSSSYMELVSNTLTTITYPNGNHLIKGKVKLKSGFSNRYPGIGTVYLEVMGSNHMFNIGKSTSIFSLGISNAINLSTNKTDLITFNNIISKNGGKTIVKYDVTKFGNLSIKVYTVSGTLVKTIYNGPVSAGKGSFDWDGTNDSGSKVASGIYYIKAEGAGLNKVDKVAVIR